jgi:hypothetical protein
MHTPYVAFLALKEFLYISQPNFYLKIIAIPTPHTPMASPHGQVSSLVSLISNAAKVIEAQYAKSSKPLVPSLDDTKPHPFDSTIPSSELKLAIQTLEGACAQLCVTVARPDHTVVNVGTMSYGGIYPSGYKFVI